MSELRQPNADRRQPPRRSRPRLSTVAFYGASALIGTGIGTYFNAANERPQKVDKTPVEQTTTTVPSTIAAPLPEVTIVPVNPNISIETPLKSFEAFRSKNVISPEVTDMVTASSLSIESSGGRCTGTVVNGYLVTAGHCVSKEAPGDPLTVKSWQDGFQEVRDNTVSTASIENVDLLVGKLESGGSRVNGIFMPSFANKAPEVGHQFITATLAGDAANPVVSPLTFLFEAPANDERGARWVFAVNPETPVTLADTVCRPGSSGSFITDGGENAAVLTNVSSAGTVEIPADWEAVVAATQKQTGVDLSGVITFCYATPTRDTFNAYIAPFGS